MISQRISSPSSNRSRISGCWLGKSIGGTLGLPAEGMMERLYFRFYDPIPTTAPPNDDLELQLVWLHLVENSGFRLTQNDFARAWLDHIHYMWDEYGICRWNLRRGIPIHKVGTYENPFKSGMGSPIRSEIWACLFAGDPDSAAHYAALDASLDHGKEGIAGEVLFSVMQSEVAAGKSLEDAIQLSIQYIPEECETALAVQTVRSSHRAGVPVWDCWKILLAEHGSENFTHAPLNVALVLWALAYGHGDFETSILLAVNAGYDTDCTAATVGATLGFVLGEENIPSRWIKPIGEGVSIGPGIRGIQPPGTLTELTERVVAASGKLSPVTFSKEWWREDPKEISLSDLLGTITMYPLGNSLGVPWANGELPTAVKIAGGATWIWKCAHDEQVALLCLASRGSRLIMNGEVLLECPPGLPYVPAPHRAPMQSRITLNVARGEHEMRLELNETGADQAASVILTHSNFHIMPWSAEEIPFKALLPTQTVH